MGKELTKPYWGSRLDLVDQMKTQAKSRWPVCPPSSSTRMLLLQSAPSPFSFLLLLFFLSCFLGVEDSTGGICMCRLNKPPTKRRICRISPENIFARYGSTKQAVASERSL
jgi:hypothetical protein